MITVALTVDDLRVAQKLVAADRFHHAQMLHASLGTNTQGHFTDLYKVAVARSRRFADAIDKLETEQAEVTA